MQAEIRKMVRYQIGLDMSSRELEMLKGMMQNPLGPGEGAEVRELRESIFNACRQAQQA